MGPNQSNDHQHRQQDEPRPGERRDGGGSGEGAGSALEAMLRKRQMGVNTEPDPSAPPAARNPDDRPPGE